MTKNRTKSRRRILFVAPIATNRPAAIAPLAGVRRFMRESEVDWDIHLVPQIPRHFLSRTVCDGIISRSAGCERAAIRAGIPLVDITTVHNGNGAPHVTNDFGEIGRLAATSLLERGLQNLVFIEAIKGRWSFDIRRGFEGAAAEARANVAHLRESFEFDLTPARFAGFEERMERFVASLVPPVGIFGFDDSVCGYLLNLCESHGLNVPNDVAVIGLFNNTLFCTHTIPTLTSIDCNFELVGYRAAELLARLMRKEKRVPHLVIVPPRGLVPRGSTEGRIIDDELVARAVTFIVSRHAGRLRTAEVVAHCQTSERTLQRRFAAVLGHSIMQEIVRQRLRHAKRLLLDDGLLMKQIARECGFADGAGLYQTFLRHERMSPLQYRREHGVNATVNAARATVASEIQPGLRR
jgi:LacI family transcriptional regulator